MSEQDHDDIRALLQDAFYHARSGGPRQSLEFAQRVLGSLAIPGRPVTAYEPCFLH